MTRRPLALLAALVSICGCEATQPAGAAPAPREVNPVAGQIAKHRMGTLSIRTAPGAAVKVTQLRHEFWFGTALSWRMFAEDVDPAEREGYLRLARENFNSAVHENALKWYSTERERGTLTYENAEKVLDWCEANGLAMRGHCIFWASERHNMQWLKDLGDAELIEAVERRAREVPARFKGRIAEYDVNNEMLHNDYFRKRLGDDIRVKMFQWAKAADPDAVMYVNDYGVLAGSQAARYEQHIRDLIARGAPVGGIGCQGHFGGSVPRPETVRQVLDRLAVFKLPIKITEFDINTDDEAKKAEGLDAFYRVCFAHPAVEGIVMWGFWEGRHWLPKAALWKRDFSPTPAAEAYRNLVFNEWWTRWEGRADAQGRCDVSAFFGRHRVEAAGKIVDVDLRRKDGTTTVVVE